MIFICRFLYRQSFEWFAFVTVSFSFFWNAALPQFEAATLHHLKDQSHRYSQVRLWGSIGFIVTVLSVGYLLDLYNIKLLPYLIVSLLASIWLISLLTPEIATVKASRVAVKIWKIVKQPEIIAFCWSICCCKPRMVRIMCFRLLTAKWLFI